MPHTRNLLAFDMGASNGRAVLGRFDGERVELSVLHRFENDYIRANGMLYWGSLNLLNQMKNGITAFTHLNAGELDCIGIDTWGVDFGLLDRNGNLLSEPRCYRHSVQEDMDALWKVIGAREIFDRTGIANLCFNTIYQLYRRKLEGDVALENAHDMLLMPDLLGYFLTGEKLSEYTNVTISQLYNPNMGDWDHEIIRLLGLPERMFTPIDHAGTLRGSLLPEIADELGVGHVPFAAVGTHDTGSAVAAIPGTGSFAFCSSGTWSLFGVETEHAILSDAAFEAGFSNEGSVQGGFRPLKNIMGLWIIQECRRDWIKAGKRLSWDDIVAAAQMEKPLRSIIDPDDPVFFNAGNMEAKIRDFCARTNQPAPETVGQVARCVYESLALKYRWALNRLEELKGCAIDSLNIVGGGIQNKLLNQMVADAVNRPVITGPIEGAVMGNVLMQAMALGDIANIGELREVVRRSETVTTYVPKDAGAYDDAYEKLLEMM